MSRSVVLALLVVAAIAACGSSEQRSMTNDGSRGWSEAYRRAQARYAWRCTHQGIPPSSRGTVGGGARAAPRKHDARCDRTRFLCQQIHRGAQATDGEKAECAGYESVHGRVSDR